MCYTTCVLLALMHCDTTPTKITQESMSNNNIQKERVNLLNNVGFKNRLMPL